MEIDAHLRAAEGLGVDAKESNMMTTKLTRKGFTMLEVSFARLFLISMTVKGYDVYPNR